MIFKRKFLISSLIILIVFLSLYNLNFQKLNVNFENYLSKETLDNIVDSNISPTILNKEKLDSNKQEKTFCIFKVIDAKKENNNLTLYLWVLAQNFSVENTDLIQGAGGEFPVILNLKEENNNFKFVSYDISKASEESESIKVFPKSIRKKAIKEHNLDEKKLIKKEEFYFNINK